MSKPYLIVNIVDGELGKIHQRDTFDEAVECAVTVAQEQCDADEEEIRQELIDDLSYWTEDRTIKVQLAQVEDD